MNPIEFPEANARHGAPEGMDESHVRVIPSFRAVIQGGAFDGSEMVVVAWKPTPAELAELNAGGAAYLSMIGGLPPHFVTTSFAEATMQGGGMAPDAT